MAGGSLDPGGFYVKEFFCLYLRNKIRKILQKLACRPL